MPETVTKTDVVLAGAGFAGLSAAQALIDAGLDVVVLEARDHVGGRAASGVNGLGERIDAGGQYFCDDMPEITKLARSHGMTLVEGLHPGRYRVEPQVDAADEVYAGLTAIRNRANEIDPNDPAIASLSVRAWTDLQPDGADAKRAFIGAMEGLWCQPAEILPFWYLISNDKRITNDVPELQYFLRETMQALAEKLAAPFASRLHLAEPVISVEHGNAGAVVSTAACRYEARHAVLALPPVMAGRIAFAPTLPVEVEGALSAWQSGKVIKALLRYDRPFWRDGGFSGSVFFLDPLGLYVTDASRDDSHPALVAFAGGSIAARWHAAGERATKAAILDKLVAALGPHASQPIDVSLRDWTDDRWSGGGYSDTIVDFDAKQSETVLRAGLPTITFASSELSPSFPGYIEGALIAGRAAAERVKAAILPRG